MVSFVLLAGGKGSRMNRSQPKQFLLLGGRPLLVHTLERVDALCGIDEIIVVADASFHTLIESYVRDYRIKKPLTLALPGETRQGSVYSGLQAAKGEVVLVHEAARPFVTGGEYAALLAHPAKNATFGISLPFTVLEGETEITGLLCREKLVNIQLPQKFDKAALLLAHEKAKQENRLFTEDASLLYYYSGGPVAILPGTEYNVKITHPVDMLLGEVIYREYILGGEAL